MPVNWPRVLWGSVLLGSAFQIYVGCDGRPYAAAQPPCSTGLNFQGYSSNCEYNGGNTMNAFWKPSRTNAVAAKACR